MLSPTNSDTSSGGPPALRRAGGDRREARVLVRRSVVGPAEHHVVCQPVRLEHGLGVGALGLQPVGDDGDAAAEVADTGEESGGSGSGVASRRATHARQLSDVYGSPACARSIWYCRLLITVSSASSTTAHEPAGGCAAANSTLVVASR